MATAFGQKGLHVAVTDTDEHRAREVASEIRAAGGQALAQKLDVCLDEDWDAIYQRVLTEWGGLGILVNNAGVAAAGRAEDSTLEDHFWVLETNLHGVIRGCHRFLPMLRAHADGHLVNVSSFAGLIPVPALSAYCTAKAGVVAFSEQLRVDLEGSGVGISLLCPAFVRTGLLDTFRSADPRARAQAQRWMERSDVTAEDVSRAVIEAIEKKRFLVLTHASSRWAWRLRRWMPGRFHRSMVAMSRRLQAR